MKYRKGLLVFSIQNNHCMMPDDFFWSYQRLEKPNGSFAVKGSASVKASSINEGIYKALTLGAEWIFLMDVDQTFPSYTIPKLMESCGKNNAKVMSVLYHLGAAPFGPVAGWVTRQGNKLEYTNSQGKNWRQSYAPLGKGVVEVDWVGSGGLLIHAEVIRDIGWAPFRDVWEPDRGIRLSGHDVEFSVRAKEAGHRIFVDTDVCSDHGKFYYFSKPWADAFNESGMAEKMGIAITRQTQEASYWNVLFDDEERRRVGVDERDKFNKGTFEDVLWEIPKDPLTSVCDFGAGCGGFLSMLLQREEAPYRNVCGFDFSESAVRIMKSRGIDAVVADARTFKPNGQKFDVVVSNHLIEHLTDDEQLVQVLKDLKKDGGKVVVTTPWREEIQSIIEHVHQYSYQDLKDLFSKFFEKVDIKKNERDFIVVAS